MPTFKYDGIRFNYEVIGSGRPLVFCHGLTGDLSQPRQLLGDIPGHSLILWDCRAHGLSDPWSSPSELNFRTFAQDLAALLTSLGIQQATVGGISMGAGVAARLSIDRPEFVSALVLIRPAWSNRPNPANLALMTDIGRLIGSMPADKASQLFVHSEGLSQVRQVSNYSAESLMQQFHKPHAVERRERLIQLPASAPIDDWGEVASIHQPTLVIATPRDPIHPIEIAQEWTNHLPCGFLREATPQDICIDTYRCDVRQHVTSFLSDTFT
jgi:pimeloyl-ACP methyl ester carboxylesterase